MATKKKSKKTAPKKATPAEKAKGAAKKAVAKKPVAKKAVAKKVAKKSAAAKGKAPKKAAAPKAKAKPAAKAKAPAAKAKAPIRRRDGAGHLDPQYAATLRAKSREGRVRDSDDAFVGRKGRSSDTLAEELGETWVKTATSGEDEAEEVFNQDVPEDAGGPFVATTGGQEFAEGTDGSNPKRSKREPFPRT